MAEKTLKDYTDYFKGRDFVHQVGFYAPDWRAFAENHHRLFGSGPFFYTTNTFGRLIYRGDDVDCKGLEFHACYGGWGSHSVEVVQQNDSKYKTFFMDENDPAKAGFNHLHIFVEDLAEAQDACEFLKIPVVTVGYADLENALAKAREMGLDEDKIREQNKTPGFMVVDMRKEVGFMVQLITPRAKALHDMIITAHAEWDGDEATLFRPLGG